MTHVICEPCIGEKDGACRTVCADNAIHPSPSTSEPQLYIDPARCSNCGLCESACPVQAIWYDYELPDEWIKYIDINRDYFG